VPNSSGGGAFPPMALVQETPPGGLDLSVVSFTSPLGLELVLHRTEERIPCSTHQAMPFNEVQVPNDSYPRFSLWINFG
jgi:hypothetical protein